MRSAVESSRLLSRILFFFYNFAVYFTPKWIRRWQVEKTMESLSPEEQEAAAARVCYYVRFGNCALPKSSSDGSGAYPSITRVRDFRFPFSFNFKKKKRTVYFLDLYRSIGHLPGNLWFGYLFGDVRNDYEFPFFVKTRMIATGTNGVIMKLNSLRHFQWVNDITPFARKKNMVVSRNDVRGRPWRFLLLEKYYGHPMCDFGMIDYVTDHPEWHRPFMSKEEQLRYKFIVCIEGNDVASNLKWVMSSNSIAVMPKPKVESWFMEGTLIGDYHYIEISDDYSNLIEKLDYYISHPSEAEEIVEHQHQYVRQFRNTRLEQSVEFLTAKAYFIHTGQLC